MAMDLDFHVIFECWSFGEAILKFLIYRPESSEVDERGDGDFNGYCFMFCSANLFIEEYIMTQRHFSKPMAH
jgi:hypothetical protein